MIDASWIIVGLIILVVFLTFMRKGKSGDKITTSMHRPSPIIHHHTKGFFEPVQFEHLGRGVYEITADTHNGIEPIRYDSINETLRPARKDGVQACGGPDAAQWEIVPIEGDQKTISQLTEEKNKLIEENTNLKAKLQEMQLTMEQKQQELVDQVSQMGSANKPQMKPMQK